MTIILQTSAVYDTVISWDIVGDKEKEAFDTHKGHVLLFDQKGTSYIVHENETIFTAQRCLMSCFENINTD